MDDQKFEKLEQNVADILETVIFLKDNMMSQEEGATKEDLTKMEHRIMGHIDGFVKLHTTTETEIAALRSAYQRLNDHSH